MKNTHITIIILILLAGGAVLFLNTSKKAEAPVGETPGSDTLVACTMDAKVCPNGSYVGRSGPKCEFDACPGPAEATGVVKEFTVSGDNFSFVPSTITVKKGDKVKITFVNSAGFHDFVIDEYSVASKKTQSPTTEVLEFMADKVGSFEYYCSVGSHRAMGMKGALVVES